MKKKKEAVKKNDEFERIKARVEYAQELAKQASRNRGFERFEDYFRGDYEKHLDINIPVEEINEVYAAIKTWLASLFIRDPYIATNAVHAEDQIKAIVQEQAINSDWRKLKMKYQVKKAIEEAGIVGRSWIGIGYTAKFVELEDAKDELNEFIDEESIWGIHIPYTHILYDWEAKDPPYDCAWIDYWYYKPVSVLEKKYKITGIKPTKTYTEDDDKIKPAKEDNERTVVHNFWDKNTGNLYIWCDGYDDFLETKPARKRGCIGPYEIKGFPFYMLKFENRFGEKDNFPLSKVEMAEPELKSKIKIRSMQLNHLKKGGRQLLIKKQSMDETERDKFEKGVDGAIIEVNDIPANTVYSPQWGTLSADTYAVENRIDIDRDKIWGLTGGAQGGVTQTKTRTLGELKDSTAGSDNRTMEMADIVEDFCEEVAIGLIGLQRQSYTKERYTRILGDVPQEFLAKLKEEGKFDGVSIKFTKDDIQCDYELDVKIGSTLPMNKANRLKVLTEILRMGVSLGLSPQSEASIAAGKGIFHDLEMPAVEKAYERDLEKLQQPQKPDPHKQMQLLKDQQGIKKGMVDMGLKMTRIEGNKLSNAKKAIETSREMDNPKGAEQGDMSQLPE